MSLSSRITDLATAIGLAVKGKQNSLISGTNIKTINSSSILGSGDLALATTSEVTAIANTVGDINTALDTINGQVI